MIPIYLSGFFIFCFGILNLLGVKSTLVIPQLIFFAEALIIFFIVKKVGRNFFVNNANFFYWLFIFFLIIVLFLAEDVRGSKRWISFLFINFQPSEFFKVFFILFLAKLLTETKGYLSQREKFITILLYFILPAFLIFWEPDLGTTIVLFLIFTVYVFISDIPKKYFIRLACITVAFFPIIWFILKPYQRVRLTSFIAPHLDKQGISYNMIQAIITTGSGGFFGKGLGLGTQSRLYFLPEYYTDFAFASLVEQFGFFGGFIVIILFAIFLFSLAKRLLKYNSLENKQETFNFYYTLGFFIMIFSQVVINIGMNMGIMPITGITLPLISYGGSSIASLLLGLALLP